MPEFECDWEQVLGILLIRYPQEQEAYGPLVIADFSSS